MAVLSGNDRALVTAEAMRAGSATREACTITKPDLRAAVDAIDTWIDANAAAFNAAIPQPARAALSARQKADLFYRVALRRLEVS
jgi:hypothetical protein